MRLFKALAVLPLTMLSCVQAQNSTEILQAAVKTLPKCALNCMMSAISDSSCDLTDFYCVAHNKELNENMEACVMKSCTIREALTAKNFSQTTYGAEHRDHTRLVSYTSMVAGGVAVLAVILRIFARLPCCGGTWGYDDWGIIVTMIPTLPLTGLAIVLANKGLGRDMWFVPFDNITDILHIYYFDEIFYLSAIALTKISILLFFLRIFPNKTFRRLVYVCIAYGVLYILAFIPVTIFQCLPIRLAWDRWDNEHPGKCINVNAEGWAAAALNIPYDLAVILLPVRELTQLAMSRRRKAGILLMFLGGGFVTIVSMLRLKYMIQFANTHNVTWDYTPVGYWSTLEVHIGILIACLPALRSLQHRLLPDTKHPAAYYGSPSGGYGYNSKAGSPFPSISNAFRSKSQSRTNTNVSQASMLRSQRSRKSKTDKDFIQLDEYEIRMDPDVEKAQISHGMHGVSTAQIERGSIHDDRHTFLDTSSLTALPHNRYPPRHHHHHDVITVRKEYNVTVEMQPESVSSSPPRMSEEDGIIQTRSTSMDRIRGVAL